jgi:hypothetical protein
MCLSVINKILKIEKNKYSDVREWWDHTECQVMLQKLTWPFINNLGRWEQKRKKMILNLNFNGQALV